MKTLKTTIKTTTYVLLTLVMTFTFSCDAEDGMDGAPGEQGVAGQDGNANVQTYTFDVSTISSNVFSIDFPELTQDVIDNDAILTYIKRNNDQYYPIPGISFADMMEVELEVGDLDIYFYNKNNGTGAVPIAGAYELVKTIIIKSTNTTNNRLSQPIDIYEQLENANIDINNYYAVCDYFGIKY